MLRKIGSFFKTIFILILIVSLVSLAYSLYTSARYPLSYSGSIKKYADEYGLDPYLVAAVISVESSFDREARSSKDARGLMQIGPSTGEWAAEKLEIEDYSPERLYEPDLNIRMGCWYLDNLSSEFDNNIPVMLAAYNGGSGNVNKWLGDSSYSSDGKNLDYIPFDETRAYVDKVLTRQEEYRERNLLELDKTEDDESFVLRTIHRIKKIVKDIS